MAGTATQIPVIAAMAFEDTIDGYFPLRESLRQMLMRNRFESALVFIVQAPAMEIPGLPPEDPVPLYITEGHGSMIQQMAVLARLQDNQATVSGVAEWHWWGNHRMDDQDFSDMHRLAEPAFIRAIGFTDIELIFTKPRQHSRSAEEGADLQSPNRLLLDLNFPAAGIARGGVTVARRSLSISPSSKSHKGELQNYSAIIEFETHDRQQQIITSLFKEL